MKTKDANSNIETKTTDKDNTEELQKRNENDTVSNAGQYLWPKIKFRLPIRKKIGKASDKIGKR